MEQDSSIGLGRIVLVKGNLSVPAGSFELNANQYEIWLTESPYLGYDAVKLDVLIPGGNKSNSMFFDEQGVPRIKNNSGEILNWQQENGYDVYKTYQQLIVTGIWQGKCPLKIDKIEWYFLYDENSTAEMPISSPTPLDQSPTLVPTNRTAIYLSQFQPTLIELPFGEYSVGKFAFTSPYSEDPIREGDPIVIHSVEYSHGIFAHAPSRLMYDIGGKFEQLSATLGLVDLINNRISCGDGVNYVVLLDGQEIYRSNRLEMESKPVDILLPITGGYELALIVEDGGSDNIDCDWAIWGDPRLR